MLDPKLLRADIDRVAKQLHRRAYRLPIDQISQLDKERKKIEIETQELQNLSNKQSKAIGIAKAKGEDVQPLLDEVKDLGDKVSASEKALTEKQHALDAIYSTIPNIPHESVPEGTKEEDNLEIRKWGELPTFDFEPQDHVDLGENLNLMDFPAATKIAGARFVVLYDALSRIHRALGQFMLDVHIREHNYREVYVPYLANYESLFGTGQLPKFSEDQFNIDGDWKLSLIPTAEVPVTNLVRDTIIDDADMPLKFVARTPCFRSEAGSYGKDTRGMIRQHQFEKVELVQIVRPENSYDILEELTSHAEAILQKLQLPYRVVALCGGDLGFSAAKTYDLEVWLPSQKQYREISSCSNFESFQARRMKARWRAPDSKKPSYVHTLNGSGLAIGRTLVALLENYQDKDGNIHIPDVLRPYLDGAVLLTKEGLK